MSDQTTNNVAEFFSPGPGERLRAARLSMGYDLAKIASELHLTSPVVEALEADEFSDIGARVFVRGYLRNYARIVGMPVDSILRQFDEKWPDDGVHHTMLRQSPTLPADGGPGRGLAGALTWLVVIAIVVLFIMWWRGSLDGIVPPQIRSDATPFAEQPAVDEPLVDLAKPGVALQDDPAIGDGSLRLPAPPSDLPTDDGGAVAPMGEGELALPAAAPENPVLVGTRPAQPAAVAPRDPASEQTLVATPATVEAAALQGAPVVDGTHQIVMSFTGPCWVDVRDSERKFKLFGEMPKGTRKVLGGKPPYKMVIGNAKMVDITVNGEPFDLTPYAKGNVARFTLNP
jgi:cytoskeleton protein RodZ